MAMTEHEQRVLPETIRITANTAPRVTPNQMRLLRAETGKTMEEVFGDKASEEDRLQAVIWLELRRQGYNASWDDAGDVGFEPVDEPPDPTSTGNSTGSLRSAATGE
jgi:hypothetical protein